MPILAHIHVPKSAGTSVRAALVKRFGEAHLFLYADRTGFVYDDRELGELVRRPGVRGFSSHFVRRFPEQAGDRRLAYVTFLRDPVEQFLSYVTYARMHYAAISDAELLSHLPPEMPQLPVRECARWILTADDGGSGFRNFRENYTTNFFARYGLEQQRGWTYDDPRYRRARLGFAHETLARFLFVGISEQMDESWRQLRQRAAGVGIELGEAAVGQENVSSHMREDLSWLHADDEVGRLLLTSVAEDRQLYGEWRRRFGEQSRASGASG